MKRKEQHGPCAKMKEDYRGCWAKKEKTSVTSAQEFEKNNVASGLR
jgi:hypothetical protein